MVILTSEEGEEFNVPKKIASQSALVATLTQEDGAWLSGGCGCAFSLAGGRCAARCLLRCASAG